ncbi:MAG: sigma 54-interacting transcriptional regulator [Gemmatimonadota bacterium]
MIEMAEGTGHDARVNRSTLIIGVSLAIRRAIETARQFADSELPILLMGETGTGKELFAQEIHRWSGRRGRLVDVNCGALPKDLIEGELFGHRRGAYTGAATDSEGLISHAQGGTLFLDELTSLPVEGQVKLLRTLETREVRRVGDTAKRQIDFRLVGAVQNGLALEVREGRFRIDLYQRLAGIVITLPPLMQRMEDVFPLAAHFSAQHQRLLGSGADVILERHGWPGNVRELRTVVERAVILAGPGVVSARSLVEALDLGADAGADQDMKEDMTTVRFERDRKRMQEAGDRLNWDPELLAKYFGISRATLYRWLKRLRPSRRLGIQSHESHQSHRGRETGETRETFSGRSTRLNGERRIT